MLLQQTAWNQGDLDAFMNYYQLSDSLTFLTSKGLLAGHHELAERYRSAYPDRETMGFLTFELLQARPVGTAHAYAIGSWHIQRDTAATGGYFSLLFEKTPEGWIIIADHTS